jgi:hypothetical protein
MHGKELAFRMCDAETRSRNRLVKQITVIHMAHSQLSLMDRRYFKVIGESGKLSEFVYPQLLLKSVGMNPPAFFHAVFSLFKPLMSPKMLEKQSLCPGRTAARPSAASCPFAGARFDVGDLPSFLGGACKCTARGGCVACRPNEETRPGPAGGPRAAAVLVGARAAHDVLLTARAAGDVLAYEFDIEDKGLEFSAWVTPDAGADVQLVAPVKRKAGGRVAGSVPVPVAGTVTLRFSNAHSVLTGKQLTVTARVEAPGGGGGGGGGGADAGADLAARAAVLAL